MERVRQRESVAAPVAAPVTASDPDYRLLYHQIPLLSLPSSFLLGNSQRTKDPSMQQPPLLYFDIISLDS